MQANLTDLMKILDENLTKPNKITQYLNRYEQFHKSFDLRKNENGVFI